MKGHTFAVGDWAMGIYLHVHKLISYMMKYTVQRDTASANVNMIVLTVERLL